MKKLFAVALSFSPYVALAATSITDAQSLVNRLLDIGDAVIYILIALAVIYIVFNVVQYVIKGSDPTGKVAALHSVLYGIAGLAIILSIWGLVGFFKETFRTTDTTAPLPSVSGSRIGGIPGSAPVIR